MMITYKVMKRLQLQTEKKKYVQRAGCSIKSLIFHLSVLGILRLHHRFPSRANKREK